MKRGKFISGSIDSNQPGKDERGNSMPANRILGMERTNKIPVICAAIFVIFFGGFSAFLFHDLRLDDAYISYRYSQNIARGNGPVFNPGEKVLGATNPLFFLAGSLVYMVFGNSLPIVMNFLGCLGITLQGLLIFLILKMHGLGRLGLFLFLAISLGASDGYLYISLETNLLSALGLAIIFLCLIERYWVASVFLGLAILTRYDVVLLAPAVAIFYFQTYRKWPIRQALAVSAIVLPWLIFAHFFYGSFLPNTLNVKFAGSSVPETWGRFCGFVFYSLVQPLIVFKAIPPWNRLGVAAVLGLSCLGWIWLGFRKKRIAILGIYPLLLIVFYVTTGSCSAPWHLCPSYNYILLGTTIGALLILRLGSKALRWYISWPLMPLVMVCSAIYIGLLLYKFVSFASVFRDRPFLGQRERSYTRIAQFLVERADKHQSIYALEVGTLAFKADRRMIDGAGLVTPELRRPTRGEDWRANLNYALERFKPDFILYPRKAMLNAYDVERVFENTDAAPYLYFYCKANLRKRP